MHGTVASSQVSDIKLPRYPAGLAEGGKHGNIQAGHRYRQYERDHPATSAEEHKDARRRADSCLAAVSCDSVDSETESSTLFRPAALLEMKVR